PYAVAVGDLNGEGKPDLVTANYDADTVSVLLGAGTGSFGANTDFGAGTGALPVAIGDVNGDGKPDLMAANYIASTVSMLLGTGTGSFAARTDFATGNGPYSVAIGDVNGDGMPDLVTANHNANTVSVLLHAPPIVAGVEPGLTRPSRFELAVPRPNPFRSLATLDFGLPRAAIVRLEIYDVQGKRIATLQNGMLPAGHHVRSWDGATTSGLPARPGV